MSKKDHANTDFSILGLDIKGISRDSFYKTLLVLTCFSVFTKIAVLFVTPNFFGSFVDLFDISYYFNWAVPTLSGHLPYIDYTIAIY